MPKTKHGADTNYGTANLSGATDEEWSSDDSCQPQQILMLFGTSRASSDCSARLGSSPAPAAPPPPRQT